MAVATSNGSIVEKYDGYGKPFEISGIVIAPNNVPEQQPLFSEYQAVYAGGVMSPSQDGKYHQVDPKTFGD